MRRTGGDTHSSCAVVKRTGLRVFSALIRACIVSMVIVSAIIPLSAQTDTTTHGWPVGPFFSSHPITGVFCEFRNTLTSDHFHNGVDIPMPDGTPVYSVYDGIITAIGTTASQGDNAYVRVRYTVSGLSKSDAYVHINPNPLLQVGNAVTGYQTVLGTILPGLGHVHFTHGLSGSEMNAIRPVGGLTPYIDVYPPRILSVRFFPDERDTEFLNGRVSGPVDIRVHVQETNASKPAEVSGSTSNNGTYSIGYKILSADRSAVVYEPPSVGVRYRFDRKPYDSDVHRVFAPGSDLSTHIYTVTNGNGADAINATRSVPNGYWDTGLFPVGQYTVMVFTEDTRGLTDTAYLGVTVERGDLLPPSAPVLKAVLNDSTNRVTISWYPNGEQDLFGYRLYFSFDGTTWTQRENETRLQRGDSTISYDNISSGRIFFRMVAVDSASPTNVSNASDVYGLRLNSSSDRTLLVDGFDRTEGSGSYHLESHPFAMTHGFSVAGDFATCANDAIIDGSVHLNAFARVTWILGDESENDETFSSAEQMLVQEYLRNGGKLMVSGSEIAYDLDQSSGPTTADRAFLHDFLKASYAADDANQYAVIGAGGTAFNGMSFRYGIVAEGSPYEEDWPDVLSAAGGSFPVLLYGTSGTAGTAAVAYSGTFPGGSRTGAVVTMGFPFETIGDRGTRDTLMSRVFAFFGGVTEVQIEPAFREIPLTIRLEQNYPNPFNPVTTIRYVVEAGGGGTGEALGASALGAGEGRSQKGSGLPGMGEGGSGTLSGNSVSAFEGVAPGARVVRLVVYDILGREVAVLVNEKKVPGVYDVRFDAAGLASGVYIYRLQVSGSSPHDSGSGANGLTETRTMTLIR